MNLEQKIEHVLQRVKDGYFEQSMPPEETDIDMVLIDCLKEIKQLRGLINKTNAITLPRNLENHVIGEAQVSCERLLYHYEVINVWESIIASNKEVKE